MKPFLKAIAMAGAAVLALAGCASQQYVQEQVGASEERIEALGRRVDAVQTNLAELKRSDAALSSRIAEASDTAQEALERARQAGKLAKGRFLYEVMLSDASVKFGFDKKVLSEEATAALDAFAARLKSEGKAVFIEIQGHTDNVGTEAYNLSLGKRRASAVKRYLYMSGGVPLHRMAAVSYGEQKPLADNGTAEGRAANRCVVLVVME